MNPLLNAVIEDRFDEALEDAKRVDRLLLSEDFLKDEKAFTQKYPLLGEFTKINHCFITNVNFGLRCTGNHKG